MIRGASSRLWSAGAAAAVAVCSCYAGAVVSQCAPQADSLVGLSDWLSSRGTDTKGICFRQTKVCSLFLGIHVLYSKSSMEPHARESELNCMLHPATGYGSRRLCH